MVHEVLHPGEVGIPLRRDTEWMNAPALALRAAFGRLSRSRQLHRVPVVVPSARRQPQLLFKAEVGGGVVFDEGETRAGHGDHR